MCAFACISMQHETAVYFMLLVTVLMNRLIILYSYLFSFCTGDPSRMASRSRQWRVDSMCVREGPLAGVVREQITIEALFGASTHDDRVSSFESGGLSRWSHGPLWIVMALGVYCDELVDCNRCRPPGRQFREYSARDKTIDR